MTLDEAIKHVNTLSGNVNLQWFICEWNDGYIIHSSSYMRQFPDTKWIYKTGDFNQHWNVKYCEKTKRFKHVVVKYDQSKRKGIKIR